MQTVLYRKLALLAIALLLLLVVPLSGSGSTVPARAVAAAPDFVITGRLYDAGRQQPNGLRGTISFLDQPLNPVPTDAQGNFTLNLPPDTYTLLITAGPCLSPVYRTLVVTGDLSGYDIPMNRRLDEQGFGYGCDDQITYNWIAGTNGHPFQGQQYGVTLPFNFSYFGQVITGNQVWISPGGYATLGAQYPIVYDNLPIPINQVPNNAVYAYWDFFDTSAGGSVYTTTVGTAPNRQFVIEWRNMPLALDPSQVLNFEAIFYETSNEIRLQYQAVGGADGRGTSATIGIENSAGTNALQYIYNGDRGLVAANTAVRIYQLPIGTLSGQVTDLYSHQPLRALVCPTSDICTHSDPNTGNYLIHLGEGSYQLQVGAYRHVTETHQVNIIAGQTTTLNIALNSAHVNYVPPSVNVCVPVNTVQTSTLTLNNVGAGPLQFRLREATGPAPVGCQPLDPYDPTAGSYTLADQHPLPSGPTNSAKPEADPIIASKTIFTVNHPSPHRPPPPGNILVYSDQPQTATISDTVVGQALAVLQWPYEGYLNDPTAFYTALARPGANWSLVVADNERLPTFQTTAGFEALRAYMQTPTGRLVFFTYGYENPAISSTLYDTLGIAQPITSSSNLLAPRDVYQWEPSEFIFRCPITLTNPLRSFGCCNLLDYGDYLRANSQGLEWAGTSIDPDPGHSMIVSRDDGRSVSLGFIVSTLSVDDNGNGRNDGIDLMTNIIKYVGNPPIPWADVPWLSESPVNGSVSPTSTLNVTLTFTSTGLTPGTYNAWLFGLTNDPNSVRGEIPITMQVNGTTCPSGTPTPGVIDLAAIGIVLGNGQGRPVAAQQNDIHVTIQNVGDAFYPGSPSLYVDVYPNWPATPQPTEVAPVWGQYTGSLQPTQTADVLVHWVAPPTPGEQTFYAWVNRECVQGIETNCNPNNPGNNRIGPIYACTFATQDYTFHDVNAPTPGPTPTGGNPFYTFIEYLACRGAITGYTCGGPGEPCDSHSRPYFRWGNPTTRGQFAKILSISMHWSSAIPTTTRTFQDVPSTNPFWFFIEQAAAHGALSGYTCGGPAEPCVPPGNKPYFRWGVNITRGQVAKAVVLGKGWNNPPPTTQQTFQDVPVSNVYWFFVEQAFAHGVLSGYNCGSLGEPCVPPGNRNYFRPGNQVTRGQLSKMITLGVTQP